MILGDARHVVVLGAGGQGKVVIDSLRQARKDVIAVFDDTPAKWGTTFRGVPVHGAIEELTRFECFFGIIALGDNAARRRIATSLPNAQWVSVIHPASVIAEGVVIGAGTVVAAGVVLQPDVCIGRHCIINTCAFLDHDTVVSDYAHLAPGARVGGRVVIGDEVDVGMGACLVSGVVIGQGSVVGAGALVLKDVDEGTVVYGVPARFVRWREQ